MDFELKFHEDAEKEYTESYLWYEEQKTGLGERFIGSVEKTLKRIQRSPNHFPKKKMNFREAVVDFFPFVIVYQVYLEQNLIHISAIYHGKRKPTGKYRKKN